MSINSPLDVVTFLEQQHVHIRHLLGLVTSTTGAARARTFLSLRRLLAIHETAEELIVHPAARRSLADGEALVAALLTQENAAKKMLAKLEELYVDSSDFLTLFTIFGESIEQHARNEEREEFQQLAIVLSEDQLQWMRTATELAEAVAPTRPHPGLESAAANALVGPFEALIDRVKDALSGKS